MELRVQGHAAYAYTGGKPFDAALPCVVFIHGALNDHSVWTLLARWFAHHGHAVLALDQPGHRRSAGALLPSIEALADWTLEAVAAAGVARASFVGHSMGSLIALEAAARAPGVARGLVMLGTAFPMKVSPVLQEAAANDPQRCIEIINALSISGFAIKPGVPGPGSWLHGGSRALMELVLRGSAPGVFAHDLAACQRYQGAFEAAASVRCPVDFLLGSRDQMTPPKSALALALALKAKVHLLDSGHALMQEQPDPVLGLLRSALSGHAP
jgi:pimeloyl-ACP methyl ester carboxylesterase